MRELKSQGLGATEIAKALSIGRASVYRALEPGHFSPHALTSRQFGRGFEAGGRGMLIVGTIARIRREQRLDNRRGEVDHSIFHFPRLPTPPRKRLQL